MTEQVKNRGWMVTFAGIGVNLAIGVLYAWSVVKAGIEKRVAERAWDWDKASLNDPYIVALLVFAFTMVPAGRMLDKLGPRVVTLIGGVLVGAGFIIASTSTSLAAWILGFGLVAGAGIGFVYAAATPAAVKWFPASRTGLVAGLVVGGFGLASAYIAPLVRSMLPSLGIGGTMLYLGIAFGSVIVLLSFLQSVPPAGYVPPGSAPPPATGTMAAPAKADYTWKEMMGTSTFWILWIIYFVGSGAGLMVIGSASKMATLAMGNLAWLAVTLLAVGNASGRVVAGMLSDRIGRSATLMIMLGFQACLMFGMLAVPKDSGVLILAAAMLIGFNYGSNLALFPAATKDYFGLKSFGMNYGIVFTAWGVGGFVLAKASQVIEARTGSQKYAFITAGCLLVLASLLTLAIRPPKAKAAPAPSSAEPAPSALKA